MLSLNCTAQSQEHHMPVKNKYVSLSRKEIWIDVLFPFDQTGI